MNPAEQKNDGPRLKRGDIGADGRVFWVYSKTAKNGESWVSSESFHALKAKKREYFSTPEMKAKKREHASTPEAKARQRKRNSTPEMKAKKREYESTPERKAKKREYLSTPERKAKKRESESTPAAKARRLENERKRNSTPEMKAKNCKTSSKSYYKFRDQAAADQFFIMANAAQQISEALTNRK